MSKKNILQKILSAEKAYLRLLSWYWERVFVCCGECKHTECRSPCSDFLGCGECEERRGEPMVDESRD